MPAYPYACRDCKAVNDHVRSIHEPPPEVVLCPECGSSNTVKTFSSPGLVFRGKGWGKDRPKPPAFDIEDRR